MTTDKSLFFYGPLYHRLFDAQNAGACQRAVDLIPEGASVLDVGCGTGQFCFALREQKGCRVVGLDLSSRMLDFARETSPYPDVTFVHQDATDLSAFGDQAFDYATMLMVIHELKREQQVLVLRESLRVAGKLILIDAVSPLPRSGVGMGIRFVEHTFGRDHLQNFQDYLAAGGIQGVLAASGVPLHVELASQFMQGCREVVVVASHE